MAMPAKKSATKHPAEPATVYWDDLHDGQTFITASRPVTREEIIAFATQFDPQPMHLDDDAAAASPFGRLTGSGWHTLALTMRLMVDAKPLGSTPLLGLGGDEVRFLKPLYPGQTLHVEAKITHLRPSSNPDKGHALVALTTFADGVPICTQTWRMLIPRRP